MNVNRTRHVFLIAALIAPLCLLAQGNVGINNPTPDVSALLDLTSTSKGLLMPRMSTAQRVAITTPATGLLVFDITLNAFYYFDGAVWSPLASGSAGWGTTGNIGTSVATHFVGTTDNTPFSFRVNNVHAGRIDHLTENVSFGRRAGGALTSGTNNTLVGDSAGRSVTMGFRNTCVGATAGASVNSGFDNTIVGAEAGRPLTTGGSNTLIGSFAGNALMSGFSNTMLGYAAGRSITTGNANIGLGIYAGGANVAGNNNIAIGTYSAYSASGGHQNIAIGYSAGYVTSTASNTIAIGTNAGYWNNGANNISIGENAAQFNMTGIDNTIIGANAGQVNTASKNTFLGSSAGVVNSTGADNTFIGTAAGFTNTTGSQNTFLGRSAGRMNAGGGSNTMLGSQAGLNTGSGANNVFVGMNTGLANTTGAQNTYVGSLAGGAAGLTKATALGYNAQVTTSNTLVLGGTGADAVNVGIGTTAPQAELEVNGFTMLGSNAPKVKMLKLTGTTAPTQLGAAVLPHGLVFTKILSVDTWVELSPGAWIHEGYTQTANALFNVQIQTTTINIINVNGQSANVLSKPVKVLITYEE